MNIEQLVILSLHRVHQNFVKARTAQANQNPGLLAEFGLIDQQGIESITKRLPAKAGLVGTSLLVFYTSFRGDVQSSLTTFGFLAHLSLASTVSTPSEQLYENKESASNRSIKSAYD
jgi:hypothetical protein